MPKKVKVKFNRSFESYPKGVVATFDEGSPILKRATERSVISLVREIKKEVKAEVAEIKKEEKLDDLSIDYVPVDFLRAQKELNGKYQKSQRAKVLTVLEEAGVSAEEVVKRYGVANG